MDVRRYPWRLPGSRGGPSVHMLSTASQLTLGGLLNELATVPPGAIVKLTGFGSANVPGSMFRHRQYVDSLGIAPAFGSSAQEMTASQFASYLRYAGIGLRWKNDDSPADDQFPGGMDTPMRVALPHTLSFREPPQVVGGLEAHGCHPLHDAFPPRRDKLDRSWSVPRSVYWPGSSS